MHHADVDLQRGQIVLVTVKKQENAYAIQHVNAKLVFAKKT